MKAREKSDGVLRAAYDLVKQHGNFFAAARASSRDRNTLTNEFYEALRRLNLPDPRQRARHSQEVRDAASLGKMGFAPVLPGFAIKSTSAKTEDGAWVKQVREPGDEFEVPAGHRVKGISALVDPDGREIAKWVKTGADHSAGFSIEGLREAFASLPATAPATAPEESVADLLTVYPVADLHLGLFSWARETGADYDLKIAQDVAISSVRHLVSASQPSETAIVLDLGDFLHADDSSNQTARSGNPLDVDTRFAKVMKAGVHLSVEIVDAALRRHKNVLYRKLPGNHDPHTSVALALALAAYYRDEPRVTVETDPSRFFFHQHGLVMLAATHGDMCKPEQIAGFAASARAEMWGKTRFRYAYFGHVHHRSKRASEMDGMFVETFGSLAAKDAWHAGMGYVAQRSMSAITYDKEHGERSRNIVNL